MNPPPIRRSAGRALRGAVRLALALAVLGAPPPIAAGKADVIAAEMQPGGDGTWRISATVRHADEGRGHYADAWQALAPDGRVLATRELHHPHVDEQPFTRSLRGVRIPPGVSAVPIRARDSVHGHGGRRVTLTVPAETRQ